MILTVRYLFPVSHTFRIKLIFLTQSLPSKETWVHFINATIHTNLIIYAIVYHMLVVPVRITLH